MSKKDLLLEIGLEEVPAHYVTPAMNQFAEKLTKWLEEKQLSHGEVRTYATPRRLAVLVKDVFEKQPDIEEEAKGPAKKIALDENGNWSKAAIGFIKGQGASVEDIYFKEINGVEYVHVQKFVKGQEAKDLLLQTRELITGLTFPKNMRWGSQELRYIRPIKWIVALFGQDVIPFEIAGAKTDSFTYGHRFLGNKVEIASPSLYEAALLEQFVIADPVKRKEAISQQLVDLENEKNWVIPVDEELLEEVNNLVEYPTALYGTFEQEYLSLPDEVLVTTMKEHQRYFPVRNNEGQLQPFFVTVRNGDQNHLENVARGNEKVLRARLSDANFFYQEDQKLKIEDAVKKLDKIVFHEELGTLGEKVNRIVNLSKQLADMVQLQNDEKENVERAASICKFDLVTHMVYEFPELQGKIGEKYARLSGEKEEVSVAINEHYMPRHAEDAAPESNVGAIVALADKLDTIVGFFAIGKIPTGSQDPYALRRQASGILQILLSKEWTLSLSQLFELALSQYDDKKSKEAFGELVSFFKLRLKYRLAEEKIRYDLNDAVLESSVLEVNSIVARAKVLQDVSSHTDFKETIEALARVMNIAKKATESDINSELFESDYETALFNAYTETNMKIDSLNNAEDVYKALASLKPVINEYFDHTMVMSDNEEIKRNRLAQMHKLSQLIESFAKMNVILVK
ncbi:glycine--tRNA ligase subunit beta [Metabacillus halosaccharovorans]|uniref:Glycine--tRNA ligase beta subunit n=1 Tax=Metabacillus halosaccharovorans TaxID=930124 RepID=A0ABT3DDI0_9BACI|nr:glycine--tRNA ligase subunit beta [Metabacillus halosaccharovorans]MCV9884888.1 glycine--tRNA ligase subunit beta [Metabacillus halosaccharovorans]